MPETIPLPSYLPVRLKRETPFTSQLGCTFILALLLLGVAVFCYFAGKSPGKGTQWVPYAVGAGFGFFGVLLLWSFVRQLAAAGLKETIVELSTEPLQPGHTARICVIQPGRARLKSLRANLVCLQTRHFTVRDAKTNRTENRTAEKLISTENLLEAKHLNVAQGDTWHEIREFSLPADAPIAGTRDDLTISWKIEVWGAGYFLASFMHPFPVDVFHGTRPEEEDDTDEDERTQSEAA